MTAFELSLLVVLVVFVCFFLSPQKPDCFHGQACAVRAPISARSAPMGDSCWSGCWCCKFSRTMVLFSPAKHCCTLLKLLIC